MTTLNNTEYMGSHILILHTLTITCTKNRCHIFTLTHLTSLSLSSFDAGIIFSRFFSGHLRPFIVSIFSGSALKHNSLKVHSHQTRMNEANKLRYSHVVGRLNILGLLASFAREIRYTTDANPRHGRGLCQAAPVSLQNGNS